MKQYPLFFLTMLILVLGVTTSALAFTFTTIDYPGSIFTEALGINNPGRIVGYFKNSSFGVHGFLAVP